MLFLMFLSRFGCVIAIVILNLRTDGLTILLDKICFYS